MTTSARPQFFLIEANEVNLLKRVMTRLYTENRMSGDDMRDNAQLLHVVLTSLTALED
jgi:hypothetical protein